MICRCTNPKADNYARYGEKGITVCDEWLHDYMAFREWALANGYEEHLTIDRIDGTKGYSPDNCRWATYHEQNLNRTVNKRVTGYKHNWTIDGITKSAKAWCEEYRIPVPTVMYRINKMGMNPKDALLAGPSGRKNNTSVTREQVEELRQSGYKIHECADILGCSTNTIWRKTQNTA
jgi:hypothetical protein